MGWVELGIPGQILRDWLVFGIWSVRMKRI